MTVHPIGPGLSGPGAPYPEPVSEVSGLERAYRDAYAEWQLAFTAWEDSGMPMDAGPENAPWEWTQTHWRVIDRLTEAWVRLRDARRAWDMARRGITLS